MIYGVYTTVFHRSIRDDFLLVFVDIGTYMRLDLLLGSAKGCLGSTCISLCGWNTLSLISQVGWNRCNLLHSLTSSRYIAAPSVASVLWSSSNRMVLMHEDGVV